MVADAGAQALPSKHDVGTGPPQPSDRCLLPHH